jgi:hypothetical protein
MSKVRPALRRFCISRLDVCPLRLHLCLIPWAVWAVLLCVRLPARALTIIPSFDPSWAAAPAGATTDVNAVIAEYEADFSNPVTITVAFGWGEVAGNPITSGAMTNFPAADFLNNQFTLAQIKGLYSTAAGSPGATSVIATADGNLPDVYPNPNGTTNFLISDAEYLALEGKALNADTIMGYTGYATNFCGAANCPYDFSGGKPPVGDINFTASVEHELSHAMGRADTAFLGTPFLTPQDFFKYDCGTPTLDPNFNVTCFSFDGDLTNPGGRTFSDQFDSGDWINFPADSFKPWHLVPGCWRQSASPTSNCCALRVGTTTPSVERRRRRLNPARSPYSPPLYLGSWHCTAGGASRRDLYEFGGDASPDQEIPSPRIHKSPLLRTGWHAPRS